MSVTVASVISRVESVLQDTSNIRWPESELVLWVNDAQREIALKPDATATNTTIHLPLALSRRYQAAATACSA